MPRNKEDIVFAVILIVISLALGWVLWPFFGALLWALLLAIIFSPFHERLLTRMPHRRNVAAIAIVLVISMLVILPLTVVAANLVQEVASVSDRFQSGEFDIER